MITGTLQIPNSHLGLLEQLQQTYGWRFLQSDTIDEARSRQSSLAEDVRQLLSAFQTDQISQDEIDRECETVREELSPLVSHFKRGKPLRVTDEELDQMRYEYLMEKLHI